MRTKNTIRMAFPILRVFETEWCLGQYETSPMPNVRSQSNVAESLQGGGDKTGVPLELRGFARCRQQGYGQGWRMYFLWSTSLLLPLQLLLLVQRIIFSNAGQFHRHHRGLPELFTALSNLMIQRCVTQFQQRKSRLPMALHCIGATLHATKSL